MNIKTLLKCLFLAIIINQASTDGSFISKEIQRAISRHVTWPDIKPTIDSLLKRFGRSVRRIHVGRVPGYRRLQSPYIWLSFSNDPRFLIELPRLSFLCSSMQLLHRNVHKIYPGYFQLAPQKINKIPTARLQSLRTAMDLFCEKIEEFDKYSTQSRNTPSGYRRFYTSTTMRGLGKNIDTLGKTNKCNKSRKCQAKAGHPSQNITTEPTEVASTTKIMPITPKTQIEPRIGVIESEEESVVNPSSTTEHPKLQTTTYKESTTDLFTDGSDTTTGTTESNWSFYGKSEQESTTETTTALTTEFTTTEPFELETVTESRVTQQFTSPQSTITYTTDTETDMSSTTEFYSSTPTVTGDHGIETRAVSEEDITTLSYPLTLKGGAEIKSTRINPHRIPTNSSTYLISNQQNGTGTSKVKITQTSGKNLTAVHNDRPTTNRSLKSNRTFGSLETLRLKKNDDFQQGLDQEQENTPNLEPEFHQTKEKKRKFDLEQEHDPEQTIFPISTTEEENPLTKEK